MFDMFKLNDKYFLIQFKSLLNNFYQDAQKAMKKG